MLALRYGSGSNAPMVPPSPVQTTLVPTSGRQRFRCPPGFAAALQDSIGASGEGRGQRAEGGGRKAEAGNQRSEIRGQTTVLHDNGLWLPTNHATARAARRNNIPLIISPRGMLTPWAMRFHGFKKRLAWWLYQYGDLQSAQVLHATSVQEAQEFRALGLTQPIAVIPNGVGLPRAESREQRAESRIQKSEVSPLIPDLRPPASDLRPRSSGLRTVLFLSRLHPKKGLLDLVRAWAAVKGKAESREQRAESRSQKSEVSAQRSENGSQMSASDLRPPTSVLSFQSGWRVVIAGGDENGHREEIEAEIRKQKLENSFQFMGEVADEQKWAVHGSADLFVLPTQSENFGIVIAEALACGVPVITTRGTPWEDLVTHRCGWWVELGVSPLVAALNEAMQLSDAERQAMGLRGRKLVEENYTWSAAAQKMVAVYQWMLNAGPKPEWVMES